MAIKHFDKNAIEFYQRIIENVRCFKKLFFICLGEFYLGAFTSMYIYQLFNSRFNKIYKCTTGGTRNIQSCI